MSGAPVRLFAAVVPPAAVLDDLAQAVRSFTASDAGPGPRWTPRPLWHLTLAFYGSDDLDARLAFLRDRLAGHGRIPLRLAGAGTFSGVVWAGADGDLDALEALATAAGAGEGGLPFHPHLTLARWKGRRPPPVVHECVSALAGYDGPGWEVAEVVLMNSVRSHDGPSYSAIERFPLV